MKIDICKFNEFLLSQFNGNYTKASIKLKISIAQINRIANKKSKAGEKSISAIICYCKRNNINWQNFIQLID